MTRQNGIFTKEIQMEDNDQCLLLSEMWRENNNFSVLGVFILDGDENDDLQEQCEYTCSEGLVFGTWQLHKVAGK